MGTLADPKLSSSVRQKWNKIFNALVHLIQMQQVQLKFLAKERKVIEDKLQLLYDRWVFDIKFHKESLSEVEKDREMEELERTVEAKKLDFLVGNADSELADFRVLLDILRHSCSGPKDTSKTGNKNGEEQRDKALDSELKRLNHDSEKLKLMNNDDVSALLSERNFLWNQYRKMERDLTDQLNSKQAEGEQANEKMQNLLTSIEQLQTSNSDLTDLLRSKYAEGERASEKIQKLLTNMEQLQALNSEKDGTIVTLKANMAKLESDSLKKGDEISRLSKELESLRKSRSDSVTPVLRRCTAESGSSQLGGKNIVVKKDPYSSQVLEKGCRSSKRKAVSISEPPKLFSSRFKVPKLKSSSPVN
ncbi:hypothetical protein RJ640_020855 [Escallonia rubra]|uniref:Uncharacterized protein n=1 Tax=Escallonia rubra TaxID=112253 RepID=A0AA88QIS3_9ASTE|nr:hypothetical protein RJ640_020855 [Escallonia rubra]